MPRKGMPQITYTGNMFYSLDPRPEEICLEDIAHGLAHQCRFNGMTSAFYSIAQHSVFVSHLADSEWALSGLLHDAAEAYLGDIIAPLKTPEHEAVEARIMDAICVALDVPRPRCFEFADSVALKIERNELLPDHPLWPKSGIIGGPGTSANGYPYPRDAWHPSRAKAQFLDRYHQLKGELQHGS